MTATAARGSAYTCEVTCIHEDKVAALQGVAEQVAGMAEVFRALGDETRAGILHLLAHDELCVCDLACLLGTSMSSLSHHLRLLRALRLVRSRRDGKIVYYSLSDGHIAHLISDMKAHMREGGAEGV